MLGSVINARIRSRQFIERTRVPAPAVEQTTSPPPVRTLRPSTLCSSASRSGAMRSTTESRTASSAASEAASRTASSAHRALRPWRSASERA